MGKIRDDSRAVWAAAIIAALVVLASGIACFVSIEMGDAKITAKRDAARARIEAAGTRCALDAIQTFLRKADAVPVERFAEIFRKHGGNGTAVGAFAKAAFWASEFADKNFAAEVFGGDALGANRIHIAERLKLEHACRDFIDSRAGENSTVWRERFKHSIDDHERLANYVAGKIPADAASSDLPSIVAFRRHYKPNAPAVSLEKLALQRGRGVWFSVRNAVPVSEKFAGGFAFECFGNAVFLVREIRAPEISFCVQGVLLDEEKFLASIAAALRERVPEAHLSFAPDDSAARELAGFPMKISAKMLLFDAVSERERSANRTFFGGVFLSVVLASITASVAAILFRRAARERRLATAAIAHDLRVPFARIIAQVSEIGDVSGGGKLRESVRRFGLLLDNLVSAAKLERVSGAPARFPATPFGKLAEPIFERLEDFLKISGVDFSAEISSEAAGVPVSVSPIALERIFENLADNVVRAAGDSAEIILEISAETDGNSLKIRIADNASGISPEARERLFAAFSGDSKSGLGIGLTLSQKLARAAGGDLRLDATSSGTAFLLTLKIEK